MTHNCMLVTQFVVGLMIAAGGALITAGVMDARTSRLRRWPVVGLVGWGVWFALVPVYARRSDGLAAVAIAALVAWVLLVHGRAVRDIIDGAPWWPANRPDLTYRETLYQRPRRPVRAWWRKLNPWWLLVANDDDGYWGDDKWRAGRAKTLALAFAWWRRNPLHNLTWYGIGVADRERVTTGRWGGAFHRPGGGWLTCWTDVQVMGVWLALPFVSYISPRVKAYAGWRPSGAFGLKLNISRRGLIEVQ